MREISEQKWLRYPLLGLRLFGIRAMISAGRRDGASDCESVCTPGSLPGLRRTGFLITAEREP